MKFNHSLKSSAKLSNLQFSKNKKLNPHDECARIILKIIFFHKYVSYYTQHHHILITTQDIRRNWNRKKGNWPEEIFQGGREVRRGGFVVMMSSTLLRVNIYDESIKSIDAIIITF